MRKVEAGHFCGRGWHETLQGPEDGTPVCERCLWCWGFWEATALLCCHAAHSLGPLARATGKRPDASSTQGQRPPASLFPQHPTPRIFSGSLRQSVLYYKSKSCNLLHLGSHMQGTNSRTLPPSPSSQPRFPSSWGNLCYYKDTRFYSYTLFILTRIRSSSLHSLPVTSGIIPYQSKSFFWYLHKYSITWTYQCVFLTSLQGGFPGHPVTKTPPPCVGGTDSIPGQGTKTYMQQLRVCMPQLKRSCMPQLRHSAAK